MPQITQLTMEELAQAPKPLILWGEVATARARVGGQMQSHA